MSSIEALMKSMVGPTIPMHVKLVRVLNILGSMNMRFKLDADETRSLTMVRVLLPDTDLELNVQTAAYVTHYPEVLCETILFCGSSIVYVAEVGYQDTCKHREEDFAADLAALCAAVKGRPYASWVQANNAPEEESVPLHPDAPASETRVESEQASE
jgi:hypothetical protein